MKNIKTNLAEIKLIGLNIRTNNNNEINPTTGKISSCVQHYFHEKIYEKIPHRKKPGTTLCVYTEYERDHTGDYTYFIGEEVHSLQDCPKELKTLIIPPQNYIKFTSGPGPMPQPIREAWFKIWQMNNEELGGKKSYIADFELYDERAHDHANVILDIFIGLK